MATARIYRSTLRFLAEGAEGLGVTLIVLLTWPVSRQWLDNWGATEAERVRTRVGDSLAPSPGHTSTRAIGIAAPAEIVWAWVVQFGLNRAGFYSYELLERLVGIPVRNAETILPAHQSLATGDEIRLHPKAPGIPVGVVEPGRHVCFGQRGPTDAATPDPRRSWSIYIDPVSSGSCRLVLRGCIEGLRKPSLLGKVGLALGAPIDFVMEQKMLRTVRRLAESVAP